MRDFIGNGGCGLWPELVFSLASWDVYQFGAQLSHKVRESLFLRVDFAVAVARAEQRDRELFGTVAQVCERYARRYVPGQQLYFSAAAPESQADVVIDNNDPAAPFEVQ